MPRVNLFSRWTRLLIWVYVCFIDFSLFLVGDFVFVYCVEYPLCSLFSMKFFLAYNFFLLLVPRNIFFKLWFPPFSVHSIYPYNKLLLTKSNLTHHIVDFLWLDVYVAYLCGKYTDIEGLSSWFVIFDIDNWVNHQSLRFSDLEKVRGFLIFRGSLKWKVIG